MDSLKKEDLDKKWKAIATRAVTDESFKKKLVADPVNVMVENGLTIPEGAEMKVGSGDRQTFPLPSNAPQELKDEVKWWEWRLDSIREFGREVKLKKGGHSSMSAQEAEEDSSGVF